MPIRVLIADDHALLRQGIKGVLDFENDIEVVGETEDGQETLARTLVLQPDILLLDLNMPGLSGMEVCKQLAAARCRVKIIALTIHDNDNYVLELLRKHYLHSQFELHRLTKQCMVIRYQNSYWHTIIPHCIF